MSKSSKLSIDQITFLRTFLDEKVDYYNRRTFIELDPISIPHRFTKLQNIEIAAFWVAMLSWGQRKTIVNKATELMALMDNAPHDFILNHQPSDLKKLLTFKHRTFQPDDTLYFIDFFRRYYTHHASLETAFFPFKEIGTKQALIQFHEFFFNSDQAPKRTRKHVSTPLRKSSCKRLNMFLRWMVRRDDRGVDFGLWDSINMSQLCIPLDVHVYKVAHQLGLLRRERTDWQAVEELTSSLRQLDPDDPIKYDFALFSIGVEGRKPIP